MVANSILLRRGRVLVPHSDGPFDVMLAATFSLNLQDLGYALDPEMVPLVGRLSKEQAAALHEEVVAELQEMLGVRRFDPMYPNFPEQVVTINEAELYWNAACHYCAAAYVRLSGVPDRVWLPRYEKLDRRPLEDRIELKLLRPAAPEELGLISRQIVGSNTSISAVDREELAWLAANGHLELPAVIPNRENLATVGALLMAIDPAAYERMSRTVSTAADVLRMAVAMSGGDVSLAAPTQFRNFTRAERRALLGRLEAVGSSRLEDMQRWRERWLRLGERLHPGELAGHFPRSAEAFQYLRSGVRVTSPASLVEAAIREGRSTEAIALLAERPGEFARRLDQLLRLPATPPDLVVENFSAAGVSTPVLLQVIAHFRDRSRPGADRIVFPKGQMAKVRVVGKLPPLPLDACQAVVTACETALEARFSSLPPLGRVYVDPSLRDYMAPLSQRSASRSLRTLTRGSRVALGRAANTLRFFIWWKQQPGVMTDLDLSAVFYGPDWRHVGHVSYFNLRSLGASGYGAYHSGDITSAPDGACEFIDVDMQSMVADGARYATMNVNSFSRDRFSTLAECSAGWMLREFPNSGEVFDPRTVEDRIDVTSDSIQVMPLLVDLVERRVVWADVAVGAHPRRLNNVAGNYDSISTVARALTEASRPTLYDLLNLHARARGSGSASSPDEADTVFSVAAGTPFEIGRLAAEFMS